MARGTASDARDGPPASPGAGDQPVLELCPAILCDEVDPKDTTDLAERRAWDLMGRSHW